MKKKKKSEKNESIVNIGSSLTIVFKNTWIYLHRRYLFLKENFGRCFGCTNKHTQNFALKLLKVLHDTVFGVKKMGLYSILFAILFAIAAANIVLGCSYLTRNPNCTQTHKSFYCAWILPLFDALKI